ncbi:MAG: serine/threonine protein kinase [Proteobacteria bacterium]|nr:serine/threonine protein kinase [Pseudomonadota bacterium]
MAEIYLAEVQGGDAMVQTMVIKRLLRHMVDDPDFNAMFLDEARLGKRLSHPNIVKTYEFGHHDDELFIAMEFVDGLDALAVLRECAHRKVRMPTEVAVYIIEQVLDALDYAHSQEDENGKPLGIVHRDISPSNVLLSRRGEVKLVDFGIARAAQQSHKTRAGTLKGKYGYMSPEQVMDEPLDARSDIFSVGIVLAELLTGRRLFAAHNDLDVLLMVRDVKLDRLDRYGSHIGIDLGRILRKALNKKLDDRFETAAVFREALTEWLSMHRHQVTPVVIAQIVESLYQDAWARKRASMSEASQKVTEMASGTGSGPIVAVAQSIDPATPAFVEDDYSEPSQIGGIPAGALDEDISGPVLDVEDMGDAVVAQEIECVDTNRLPGFDRPVQQVPGTAEALLDRDGESAVKTVDEEEADERVESESDTEEEEATPVPRQFPSIDAALSALGSPSAREFDGSEISVEEDKDSGLAESRSLDSAFDSDGGRLVTPVPGEPDDAGDFAESPPIAVIYRLAVSRATGLLVTSIGGISKHIYVRHGIPEYVSSNVATELFGEYMVKLGVLSPGELSMALAVMPQHSGKLGDTLVALGLLKPLDVFRYLTRQVRDKLIDVCTWFKGHFEWYGGREHQRDVFPLDLNTFEVLGAGAMALPFNRLDEWGEKVARSRPRMVADGRTSPDLFQLGELMDTVCDRLDGHTSIAELRRQFADQGDESRFLRILYLLIQTELALLTR